MTQPVRDLLAGAVADLVPRSPDPVAAVVGRGRAARRRTVAVATVAVAVLLGGGAALGGQVMSGDGSPGVAGESPPGPRLIDGRVVVGHLSLPVPAGWKVVNAGSAPPCGELVKTVLLIGPMGRGCQIAPIEVAVVSQVFPMGILIGPDVFNDPTVTSPDPITLHGGEPAWLGTPTGDEVNNSTTPGYSFYNQLLLPWSRVDITLRVNGPEQRQIIDSIRSTARRPARLVLPPTALDATLNTPDSSGRITVAGHRRLTDPTTIAAVLDLLRKQTATVDGAHACAAAGQPAARLTFQTSDSSRRQGEPGGAASPSTPGSSGPPSTPVTSDSPSTSSPSGSPSGPVTSGSPSAPVTSGSASMPGIGASPSASSTAAPSEPELDATTTVIITLASNCREAVSSDGGRVHLSAATVDQIKHLFGIETR